METEISIFDIPEKEISVNKSKRELEYEDLKRISKLSGHHFENFYDLELLNEELAQPDSNILSILCKYAVLYCMPLITNQSDVYSIPIQSDIPIAVYNIDTKRQVNIPSYEQINVVGLKYPVIFIRNYDKTTLAHFDHVTTSDLASTGTFGLYDQQTKKYTQLRDNLSHYGTPRLENTIQPHKRLENTMQESLISMFKDDESTKQLLISIIDYLKDYIAYYNASILTLYLEFKSRYKPNFINDGRVKWIIKQSELNNNVLKAISPAIDGVFGVNYSMDILYNLDFNRLVYAYNIGQNIGIDNKLFKKEIAKHIRELDFFNQMKKQINLSSTKLLELSRKRYIAYKKYAINNLDLLDTKQKKIIELEYKKLVRSADNQIGIRGKLLQKLFRKLDISFADIEPDRIEANLRNIEKECSKAELNGNQLLDGGVCVHIYHKGKTILDNFGKPWLNTELKKNVVDKYSLPVDLGGYFCRICGEHLADADNEGISRFIAGERVTQAFTEDPLQTTIWKEAMYIISTYVKFNTPIPLKPFVSSIASGLRNIIGEKEAKLIKSRTNTTDSIRDTVNLYANIYIYATLCAIMLSNPNKIMFGREKSNKDNTSINKASYKSKRKGGLSTNTKEDFSQLFGISDLIKSTGSRHRRLKDRLKRKMHKLKKSLGGEQASNTKLYERYLLTTALNLILFTKDAIIKRLKNINIDIVKQLFLKDAYRWASLHSKPIKIEHKSYSPENRAQTIIDEDPYYRYVYYAKNLIANTKSHQNTKSYQNNKLKSSNVNLNTKSHQNTKLKSSIDFYDTKKILNRDITQINEDFDQGKGIYDDVVKPEPWSFTNTVNKVDKKDFLSSNTVAEYQKLYDKYTYDSFLSMYDYVNDTIYMKAFMPRHVQVVEYYKKYAHVLIEEKNIIEHVAKEKLRPLMTVDWTNDVTKHNNFDPAHLDLAQFYCPNGERHKTGTFVYKQPNTSKLQEFTQNDINTWLKNKDIDKLQMFGNMQLIDERCSKCNKLIRTSVSSVKSDKLLSIMFRKIDDMLAFYQYYETRCPKGDLHDIINGKCKKCGFISGKKHDTYEEHDSYYEKHLPSFKKIEREKQAISINSLERIKQNFSNIDFKKNAKLNAKHDTNLNANYKYSLKQVAEWSQMTKTKYNVLINLGLMENNKYEDIEAARFDPSKKIDNDNDLIYRKQALILKGYINQILREYNVFMNHESIIDIPLLLKNILKQQQKIEISKLTQVMPQFKNEFIKLDNQYKYNLSSKNYANFLLEYLASIIVKIGNVSNKKYETVSNLLIEYFTKQIIEQEKIYSVAESIFSKVNLDISTIENASDIEKDIVDDFGFDTEQSEKEFSEDAAETYENEIADMEDAYDVENAEDIWDVE